MDAPAHGRARVVALLRCPAVAVLLVCTASGCVARHYVPIAEALSSPTAAEGVEVAPRMFTAPQLVEACSGLTRIARLRVVQNPLVLPEGSVYDLKSLSVVAVTAADVAVPAVPLVIEVEDRTPPVVQLRSDDPDINAGRVRTLRSGLVRFRVRTTCGRPPAETTFTARVE